MRQTVIASERVLEIMRRTHSDQRVASRMAVCLSAKVSVPCVGRRTDRDGDCLALIRDISSSGMFFYSNYRPTLGERLTVRYKPSVQSNAMNDDAASSGAARADAALIPEKNGRRETASAGAACNGSVGTKEVRFEGTVVRLVTFGAGTATGIAVSVA